MRGLNWKYDFDPVFPAHMFHYCVKGSRDQMHWHRYFEIGLCTAGSGRFFYFNKRYLVHEGDIFISNNYESHVATAEDGKEAEYIFLILLPSYICDGSESGPGREYLETFQYNPLDFINRIPADSEAAQRIAPLMRAGLASYLAKEQHWRLEMDICVRSVLLELSRHYMSVREDKGALPLNPRIRSAQEYINSHYSASLTVEEVAQAVGMNASYFRHLFKEEVQISFKEYVTQLRLSHARTRLQSPEENINKIIEEVGYTNISQFYRVFRQQYNMTPAEYRRLNTSGGTLADDARPI